MSTKIEWTEETWNPIIGCSKVSPGCQNCYAERMAYRIAHMGNPNYSKVVKSYFGQKVPSAPDDWYLLPNWNGKTHLVESTYGLDTNVGIRANGVLYDSILIIKIPYGFDVLSTYALDIALHFFDHLV